MASVRSTVGSGFIVASFVAMGSRGVGISVLPDGVRFTRRTLTPRSDDFDHDLTGGPALVHHGVRFMEPLERETRSELERELTGLNERDVFLKLRARDLGRLTGGIVKLRRELAV